MLCFCQILEKKWDYDETVYQLFIELKNSYYSGRMEVLHSILTEFGVPMKLARMIKMCLSETYSEVKVKYLLDIYPVQYGLKQGDALSPLLFNCAVEYDYKGPGNPGGNEIKWETSASGLH
jgi:hypothetical protein